MNRNRLSFATSILLVVAALLCSACVPLTRLAPSRDYINREQGVLERTPSIGLSLAGGGSKSAPFVMGVLEGLQDSGILEHVDAISSVSGGSYAALWYYTRLQEAHLSNIDSRDYLRIAFNECLPADQRVYFAMPKEWAPDNDPTGLCPIQEGAPSRNYWQADLEPDPWAADLPGDPLRFASQVRAHQDILESGPSYAPTSQPWPLIKDTLDYLGLLTFDTSLASVAHNFANSLFDWRINLSLSRHVYDTGIVATYGATPARIDPASSHTGRPQGDSATASGLTFLDLRRLVEGSRDCAEADRHRCHVPLWIINTTAGTSSTIFLFTGHTLFTPEQNVFEFTPFGYGSGVYGHYDWTGTHSAPGVAPDISVATAVGASAAFFDPQQRTVGGPAWSGTVNFFLHSANLDWGTDIPNYGLPADLYHRALAFHVVLPWPLYLFHRHAGNANALKIHLSDGGMVENLGIASLVQRHTRDIIVADSGSDSGYTFDDLCTLDKGLRTDSPHQIVQLDVTPLANDNFAQACAMAAHGQAAQAFGTPQQWTSPVLRGRICREDAPACDDSTAESRLYILKPFLNRTLAPQIGEPLIVRAPNAAGDAIDLSKCALPSASGPHVPQGYPCEVVAFEAEKFNFTSPFPQHSTWKMTAYSSPYLYGAYHELGRYYASALAAAPSGSAAAFVVRSGFWPGVAVSAASDRRSDSPAQ